MLKKQIQFFFYGNYFYGFCAVALSIETALQLNISLNSFIYYCFVFTATIFYYTLAFPREVQYGATNKRSAWYAGNKKLMLYGKILSAAVSMLAGIYLLIQYTSVISGLAIWQWIVIVVIIVQAVCYYGFTTASQKRISLRSTGWLKPFVIGFVWAGLVTTGPVFLHQYLNGESYEPILLFWFFIQNWMFITVLSIMFDIKDHATDYNKQLKTFVVRAGLRKTIFYIIIPLTVTGFVSYIFFVTIHPFPFVRIVFNSIPFIMLVIAAWSLHKRKPILYYLAIIDGLMFLKAVCGIAGVVLSK